MKCLVCKEELNQGGRFSKLFWKHKQQKTHKAIPVKETKEGDDIICEICRKPMKAWKGKYGIVLNHKECGIQMAQNINRRIA